MRADMGKVLVERPRVGSRSRGPCKGYNTHVRRCLEAGDSPPKFEGIKRRAGNTKSFNEHLGPLRRFLDSNVGRPWDKVYAEICKHVDRGNVVQKHILTHLFEYVVTIVILIDGVPCHGEAYARLYGQPLRTSHNRHQWYVCPKSGLLRRSRYIPRESNKRPEPSRTVRLNNKQVCVDRGGWWELISILLVTQCDPQESPTYNVILQEYIDGKCKSKCDAEVDVHRGGNIYVVTRRPLLRKDLLALPIPIEWLP